MGLEDFSYNAEHRVVVCLRCRTCLIPGKGEPFSETRLKPWTAHLRSKPHQLRGQEKKAAMALFSSHNLRDSEELRLWRPDRRTPCRPIEGLRTFSGYLCLCDKANCDFATQRLQIMVAHIVTHGRRPLEHRRTLECGSGQLLWQECTLQTYSTSRNRIDYFVVAEEGPEETEVARSSPSRAVDRDRADRELLLLMLENLEEVNRGLKRLAARVEKYCHADWYQTETWLTITGFPMYLQGLRNAEIYSSYRLPRMDDLKEEEDKEEAGDLLCILSAAESLFRDAYRLVSDEYPGRQMTPQRARVLSGFTAGAGEKGNDAAFRCFMDESTLVGYFRKMKELLVYYYRVAYREGGHFSQRSGPIRAAAGVDEDEEFPPLPEDIIRPTVEQRNAMDAIFAELRKLKLGNARNRESGGSKKAQVAEEEERWGVGENEIDEMLKPAVREFYMQLICHTVGSQAFQSPVLSFCAMISRTTGFAGDQSKTQADKRRESLVRVERNEEVGIWHEAGIYNSSLSALVWMAQLLIFEGACYYKDEHGDQTLRAELETLCGQFMNCEHETAFGFILQWQLYLATVRRSAISPWQPRWSFDYQELTYLGITLHVTNHIPQLILTEYRRAYDILHDTLLFGAKDIKMIKAHQLYDDLDAERFGGSWTTDPRNAKLLAGVREMLVRKIWQRPDLQRRFFTDDEAKKKKQLDQKSVNAYETKVQEFLEALATLVQISPMPPPRASELLLTTCTNTRSQRRSLLLWDHKLMLHIRPNNSSEQTIWDDDIPRFIPADIAELILTFIAMVQPLRLVFRRMTESGASRATALSPYLFSNMDGTEWQAETLSRCLSQSCIRAKVPEFQDTWWQEAAASIIVVKLAPRWRAGLPHLKTEAPEEKAPKEEATELEGQVVDQVQAYTHSSPTPDRLYAGTATVETDTALHRAHQTSESWRGLLNIDHLLAEVKISRGRKRAQAGEREEAGPVKRTRIGSFG
ncbi:hypothetical protein E4U13_005035 [Claviceps humidiphila]|uniref:Uncharacterized protein n=1 Tax=Claviceps humidiphila TaxID=1294629 RepID=A0A9P7Q7A9_9HYPO|nr:hypothetical protein E4U13_005035 [Claviceps humidiphila]